MTILVLLIELGEPYNFANTYIHLKKRSEYYQDMQVQYPDKARTCNRLSKL